MIRKRRPFFVRLSAFDPFAHADGTDLSVSTTNIPLLGPSWPKLKFSKIKLPDHVSLSTFFPRSSFVGYSRVCRTPADWRMFGCLYSANIRDTKIANPIVLSASLGRRYPTVFASLANVRGSAKPLPFTAIDFK